MRRLITISFLAVALSGCVVVSAPVKLTGKVVTKTAKTAVKTTVKAAIPNGDD